MSLLFIALIALVHPVAGMLLFVVWLIWGWVFDRSDEKAEAERERNRERMAAEKQRAYEIADKEWRRNHGFPP
jgi:hypothetical protein